MPGPGSYYNPSSFVSNSDSLSKKGYGQGFVSKVKRTTYKELDDPNFTLRPGPGKYEIQSQFKIAHRSHAVGGNTTANFRVAEKRHTGSKNLTPGPGQYNPSDRKLRKGFGGDHAQAAASAFKSNATRGAIGVGVGQLHPRNSNIANPGSGAYESTTMFAGSGKLMKAAFGVGSNRSDPTSPGRPAEQKDAAVFAHPKIVQKPARMKVPGPGQYDIRRQLDEPSAKPEGLENSSSFTLRNQDRFGAPVKRKVVVDDTPGPGMYHKASFKEKSDALTACFKGPSRGGIKSDPRLKTMERVPGPAFYKPSNAPVQKSFHLNAEGRWIG
jgi:hypothetical protein